MQLHLLKNRFTNDLGGAKKLYANQTNNIPTTTVIPTVIPTDNPTEIPTDLPTDIPTDIPSISPILLSEYDNWYKFNVGFGLNKDGFMGLI